MNEILHQYRHMNGPWVFCSEEEYQGRIGNWDFEMRRLQVLGDDVPEIPKEPFLKVVQEHLE